MQRIALTVPTARIAGALLLVVMAVVAYATGGRGAVVPAEAGTSIGPTAVRAEPTSPSMALLDVDDMEHRSPQRSARSLADDNLSFRIRSALGLPLEHLEWRTHDAGGTSGAAWRPVPFQAGEWLLPLDEQPLELREPLHLLRVVASGTREVVLEPRAVLTLRGADDSSTGPVAPDTFSLARGLRGARWT